MNFNRLCSSSDWKNPTFVKIIEEVTGKQHAHKHRKFFEWATGVMALQKYTNEDSVVLGIGSGCEAPVFYLTNKVRYVMCTDLYITDSEKWNEADTKMLTNPDSLAPYKYNRRRLGVMNMDGTDLRFEDNTFDAVFSYSSIEHFGGKNNAVKCMKEIERVLKPNGVCSIATELFVGDESALNEERQKVKKFPISAFRRFNIINEMFTHAELKKYVINATDMQLIEPMDYSVNKNDVRNALKYPVKEHDRDHLFLSLNGMEWTSVHLCLQKLEK